MEWMHTRPTRRDLAQVVGTLLLVNVFVFAGSLVGAPALAQATKPLHIVAFGDSLSSGFGLKPAQSFPAQLQKQLKERGHNVVVTNAGVAGDTTAAGLDRLAWSLPNDADAVIVEFGANDMLRGIDPKQTRANLEKMIAALKKRRVAILLTGMRSLANWGEAYERDFDAIFPDLAREHELVYYPFFLDGVALDAKLNLDDGLHPSGKGIAEIVNRIMPKVEELITRAAARREAATKS
jgi:acyl-CoA thioesterase-1